MSAGIKVTPEQLQSYSGTVKQRAGDVEGISTGLSKQLEALVGADWAGAASGQFGQLWQQWHKGAKDMVEALNGIAQLLNNAGTAYAEAEGQIARSFSV
ncbi:MAG: WXG100 family type VII secretion target [Actinobacteria bacterium]|nr:WXG100 family type VII secretion target [Actinomycetota bacterium]